MAISNFHQLWDATLNKKGVMTMKKNMGNIDRLTRVVIGIIALILALFFVGGAWGIVLWIVAALMLVTALFTRCLLYVPFGIRTCKNE